LGGVDVDHRGGDPFHHRRIRQGDLGGRRRHHAGVLRGGGVGTQSQQQGKRHKPAQHHGESPKSEPGINKGPSAAFEGRHFPRSRPPPSCPPPIKSGVNSSGHPVPSHSSDRGA